jgi:Methylene-tetrahydrofolate reductase C terminal
MSKAAALLAQVEHVIKRPIWGCKMCGQCVLHDTGMTCPMTCPKTLRNGPCGGVRADGTCEVKPEMRCVWLKAYERSEKLPVWGPHIDNLRPPVDNQLQGTSSWINLATGRDKQTPPGWRSERDVES